MQGVLTNFMEEIKILDNMIKCTGCAACANICPKNAISMEIGHNTFLYPIIDNDICIRCKRCIDVCPVNLSINNNNAAPDIFAVKAEDSIRGKSSSGGFFSVAANYILANGGVVYGAAFDNEHKVIHIRASEEEELARCRGSKYVQSYIGFIYRRVKVDLDNGLSVLFTGCPCQVAGLNNYLKKKYNNLIVADLVCHGVPSQRCFDLYLNEKADGVRVDNIYFRSKRFGWRSDIMEILFGDSTEYVKSFPSGDEFEIGFQENYILRDSCENCKFCKYPRVGDITFGDFWGIEKFMPNDGKGTSMIFINNEKGKHFFESLLPEFPFHKKIEAEYSLLKNRLFEYYPHNKNKKLFFKLLPKNGFCKSIKMAKSGKYDVALVGIPTVENFGGALTYLALFNYIKELGYACVIVERPCDSIHPPTPLDRIYNVAPYESRDIIDDIKSRADLYKLNDVAERFLVGSDQLFAPVLMRNFQGYALLDWVADDKHKIAYGASFGSDNVQNERDDIPYISFFLKKFDAFSVRENSAVNIAKEKYGIDAVHVLDPVFLCNGSVWESLLSNASAKYEGEYIAGYILDPNEKIASNLNHLCHNLQMPLYVYSEMFYTKESIKRKWTLPIEVGKIEDRLLCIKNSKLFVTDSFHGMCMALLLKKDFVVILNKNRGANRFISVLSELGLESRIVNPGDDIYAAYFSMPPLDYEHISSMLEVIIKKSKDWLKTKLAESNSKSYSDRDIITRMVINENKKLTNRINLLESVLGLEYCSETDLYAYLDELIKNSNHTLVCVAAKDTPGMSISNELMTKLYKLGIKVNLVDKHWCGFIAVIYNHVNICEKCLYDKTVSEEINIAEISLKMKSSPLHDGNTSEIIINNMNYSVNSRGLNFVVYDTRYQKVVDSCGFDTHDRRLTCIRKS